MLPNTKQDIMDISNGHQNSEYKLKRGSGSQGVDDILFDLLSDENGQVALNQLWADIKSTGLRCDDPRLKESWNKFQEIERKNATEDGTSVTVDRKTFKKCTAENLPLIIKAFKRDLVIPEFSSFTEDVESICEKCKGNKRGKIADYIPQLARVSPDLWAVSICTVDGQRYSYGDCDIHFCIQAVSKPLSYALATSDVGAAYVHGYVGQEPSGGAFNQLTLNHNDQPHNPLINSGAIVTNSLIKPKLRMADRFDFVFNEYKRMAGNEYVGFSNATYLSEKSTADRNFALGYYMRERSCFPDRTDLMKTLEFYFQMCSIETTTESASVIAATLAHGGVCPITGEKVLAPEAVRNTLALMHSCGMNDYSGQFAFKVGLPAKSGVAGAVLLVVPNVMGICCYSPPLDSTGNSCRGVQFCEEFVNVFNFHNYDHLTDTTDKLDPRARKGDNEANNVFNLLFSAAAGDVTAIRRFARSGVSMEETDYDDRTALHVSAAEGHLNVITTLIEKCKVNINPRDRWGHTPYDDAVQFGHDHIAAYLEKFESNTNSFEKEGIKNTSEKSSSGYSSKSASAGPDDKW